MHEEKKQQEKHLREHFPEHPEFGEHAREHSKNLGSYFVGPATTQNLVVKFDGEICGGVWWKMLLTIFPTKEARIFTRERSQKFKVMKS